MRQLILSILILVILSACSSPVKEAQLGGNFTALIVEDMDVSMDWYVNKLGFDSLSYQEVPERGLKQANLKFESNRLELIYLASLVESDSIQGVPSRPPTPGIFKFGYQLSDFDGYLKDRLDIDSTDQRIVVDPISEKRMIVLSDPDGNRVQLFEN